MPFQTTTSTREVVLKNIYLLKNPVKGFAEIFSKVYDYFYQSNQRLRENF